MTVIEQDIISIIAVLVSCFLAVIILSAICTLAWLKGEKDYHDRMKPIDELEKKRKGGEGWD